VQGKGVY
jgi:hypothetical protein